MPVAAAVALVWGLCFVLIRLSMDETTPLFSAGVRALLGGLVLGTWVATGGRHTGRRRYPSFPDLVYLALTNAAIAFGAMYLAAERSTAVIASVLAGGQPILLAVAGWLLFGDRLGKVAGWGFGLGLLGVGLVGASASGPTTAAGVVLALLAAAAPALGTIRMRRLVSSVDVAATTAAQFLLGGVVLVLLAAGFEDLSATRWSAGLVVSLGILGVLGTGLAYAVWFALLDKVGLVVLGGFLFTVPVVGVAGGLVTGERPGPGEAAAALVILVGIALVMWDGVHDRTDPDAHGTAPG